jgi:hypothetical protein
MLGSCPGLVGPGYGPRSWVAIRSCAAVAPTSTKNRTIRTIRVGRRTDRG